jgi:sugar lactone lactonase YvrE
MKKIVVFSLILGLFSTMGLLSLGSKAHANGDINNHKNSNQSNNNQSNQSKVKEVASFKGFQVTGVSVANNGRIFANFPRWRNSVSFSVVEVKGKNKYDLYPNMEMNSWKVGDEVVDNKFIAVQSVVAHGDKLYILDTANPFFKGTIANPRIFVFDIKTNQLLNTYKIPYDVLEKNSYVNDLVVDDKNNKIYMTDSEVAGIVILDLTTQKFKRVLHNHPYTKAEVDKLTFDGKSLPLKVNSDGIAFDSANEILYIHALSGYTLYGIKVSELEKKNPKASIIVKTSAPDGMVFDNKSGNLYFADLENHKINYLKNDGKTIETLVEGDKIKWADSFSINGCDLYFTNSRIHEVIGLENVEKFAFTINKIKLPSCN